MATLDPNQVRSISKDFSHEEFSYEVSQAVGDAAQCEGLLPALNWLFRDVSADQELRFGEEKLRAHLTNELSTMTLRYDQTKGTDLSVSLALPRECEVWQVRLSELPEAEYRIELQLADSLSNPAKRAQVIQRFAKHLYEGKIKLSMHDESEIKEKATQVLDRLSSHNK